MPTFASIADRDAVEAEMPWEARERATTMYDFLSRAKAAHGARPALSFQITSGPKDRAETLTWAQLHARVTQVANLLRKLGVGETDTVAYLLPNCLETAVTLLAGSVAGIVNPVNPLLEAEQIAAILRETKTKVLVTLKSFPKSDIAQKAAEAVKHAPNVQTVLEIDLNRYLSPPKSLIVPFIRPKTPLKHHADVFQLQHRSGQDAGRQADVRGFGGRPCGRLFPYRRHHRHAEGGAAQIFGDDL